VSLVNLNYDTVTTFVLIAAVILLAVTVGHHYYRHKSHGQYRDVVIVFLIGFIFTTGLLFSQLTKRHKIYAFLGIGK